MQSQIMKCLNLCFLYPFSILLFLWIWQNFLFVFSNAQLKLTTKNFSYIFAAYHHPLNMNLVQFKLYLLIFSQTLSHLNGFNVIMTIVTLKVFPAFAAPAQEDIGVWSVQDWFHIQVLDTAMTAGAWIE